MTTEKIPCYVFDIDGTLANGDHRLHHILKQPKDWKTFFAEVGKDEPISHMIKLIRHLSMAGMPIVYVTGRSDECRDATVEWIRKHVAIMSGQALYMRKAGDYTDDNILKVQMLEQVRSDGFEPIMMFDDRNRVVKAVRESGLPVMHVAEGDF